jgi:hypothetical protein
VSSVTRSIKVLRAVEGVVVLVGLGVGWYAVTDQLLEDGWIAGGGTAWMFAFAIVASLGAVAWIKMRTRGPTSGVAASLILVSLSPVTFAYPISVGLLSLAVLEVGAAHRARHQTLSQI